tara:strand:- start:220 stop:582 length:363 start_codon:yes stop_codon:yes gene_type:complete
MGEFREILDLSGKDLELNERFIRKFCSFEIEHLFDIHSRRRREPPKPISLDVFLENFDNSRVQIGFGYPEENITLSSSYLLKGTRYMLLYGISIVYQLPVLDLYESVYGELPGEYVRIRK